MSGLARRPRRSAPPEEGKPFEFGLNYTESGFCKLCNAVGDRDLLPFICAMDKDSYGIRGVELQRTTTLAGGHSHCNFRF
ncbi:L-2-amino-thiazoline-4-carboxylic acid hydrolase [Neorhizobium vignae]|uniref:L-2-amino-thiazoline-4-carboxylic acid hydrolase n=1 Tax=Neorhizobium vignae TaxID=690585 RepID=UPI00055DFECB|nr:L-2-amino-thiazoline-4-carboxylic acid hydrolase [Neorhizobium vignae]